jgi:hypothetical protein
MAGIQAVSRNTERPYLNPLLEEELNSLYDIYYPNYLPLKESTYQEMQASRKTSLATPIGEKSLSIPQLNKPKTIFWGIGADKGSLKKASFQEEKVYFDPSHFSSFSPISNAENSSGSSNFALPLMSQDFCKPLTNGNEQREFVQALIDDEELSKIHLQSLNNKFQTDLDTFHKVKKELEEEIAKGKIWDNQHQKWSSIQQVATYGMYTTSVMIGTTLLATGGIQLAGALFVISGTIGLGTKISQDTKLLQKISSYFISNPEMQKSISNITEKGLSVLAISSEVFAACTGFYTNSIPLLINNINVQTLGQLSKAISLMISSGASYKKSDAESQLHHTEGNITLLEAEKNKNLSATKSITSEMECFQEVQKSIFSQVKAILISSIRTMFDH